MKTLRKKFQQLRVFSKILHANTRLQIAGAMYIAAPTPRRYAKFKYRNTRLNMMLSRMTNAVEEHRASEASELTGEEKRLIEFINKQMETIGLN